MRDLTSFQRRWEENLKQRAATLAELDKAEDKLLEEECAALTNSLGDTLWFCSLEDSWRQPGEVIGGDVGIRVALGDRVMVGRKRTQGTIVGWRALIDIWDDDYYNPQRVSNPDICIEVRIKPDPSPVRGLERDEERQQIIRLCSDPRVKLVFSYQHHCAMSEGESVQDD
jgi:hypothetical protein